MDKDLGRAGQRVVEDIVCDGVEEAWELGARGHADGDVALSPIVGFSDDDVSVLSFFG